MAQAGLPDEVMALLPRDWRDWAAIDDKEWLGEEGRRAVAWATEVVADFYGDAWYRRNLKSGTLPLLSPYDRPTSGPAATIRHIERAARIELLPDDVKTQLASGPNGIRSSLNGEEFDHLDVILEVIGLALRDGWKVACEITSASGKLPDVFIHRLGCGFTIEVTTQGFDRQTRLVQAHDDALRDALCNIERRYAVECYAKMVRLPDEDESRAFLAAVEQAARRFVAVGRTQTVDLDFATATVSPRGQRPPGASYEGPAIRQDMWPRFARRLQTKAQQTLGRPAWIRIDEGGGLLHFTSMYHRRPPERLELLRSATAAALTDYPHVQGVIISHGAGPDWIPTQRPADVRLRGGSAYIEQRLPGDRRRQSYILNLHRQSLLLPPRFLFQPADWYLTEGSWLDWAARRLDRPRATQIVVGEYRRCLLP